MLDGDRQREQRQDGGGDQRLDVNLARLPLHLGKLGSILDLLFDAGEVARTARRQRHSSLIAPLEEADRRGGEQDKERQPPQAAGMEGK